ncbi:MAG TPA: tetratricopeptide repeat protein, partial [Verrucomicrobiota bacterium]|nr:tetratricopeptide repeat protein [Verrucomicrobiota bacterium]
SRLNPFKKKTQPIVTPLPFGSEKQVASAIQEEQKEKQTTPEIIKKEEKQVVSQIKVAKVDLPPPFPKYNYLRPQKPLQGNRDEAQKKLLLGLKDHNAGDLKEAKSQYEEAVKLDPSFFEANYNLAVVLYELGELDEALKRYEYALAINPDAPNARFNFALALQKGNYLNDAVIEYENYLKINPQDNRARLLLANIYAQQLKDKTNATKQYLEILRTEPNHPQALAIHEWLKQNSQ